MSIANRIGQADSVTEGWRAFDLFTDRFDLIHNFASYLNDNRTKERILYFCGEGGNGKSLLLKFLQEHCCKYIDARNWEWIKSKPEEEFVERLKTLRGAEDVPSASIDFNPNPGGDTTIQDPFSALLTLRRALTHPNLHYPLFDFACAWYLANGGKLTDQQRQYLLLAEGTKFIAKIIDAISKNLYGAVATAVLNIYNKDLTEWFNLYTRRRKLSAETIKEIQRLTPESKLLLHLPRLFAEDLNDAMLIEGAPKRVVLFFDAHEAFWGIEHKLSEDLFFQRDEWLRSLLAHLELSRGIVVVVAGREPPRWAQATKPGTIISDDFIDLQHVAPLSEEHALQYLQRAEIDDPVMRECLVAYANVGPRQVHPLYLGLSADVVLAAREKGRRLTPKEFQSTKDTTDKGTELIRRLLRYVDDDIAYPVRALSACRAFDKELYFRLGEALKLGVTEQSFNTLIRFSFVWRAERRESGLYRLHKILRRLFYEREDEINRRANEFLYEYYRLRGDNVALAESTYHSNQLHGGVDGWLLCFHSGMEFGQYELCRLLLEVRNELRINRGVELGRVLDQEGDYFERIAKYEEAEQSFVAATIAFNEALLEYPQSADIYDLKGHTLHNLGTLQARLSRHVKAYKSYREALSTFNIILRHIPDHRSKTGKGLTLVAVGDLLALRSKTDRAAKKYKEAIHIFEDDIKRWSGHADSHGHLGHAHVSLGNIQFELSQYDEAIESFKKAISAYDEAIRHVPVFFRFHHNKGNTLVDLGDVQFRLKQYEHAEKSYINAVACYDKALQHSPDTTACWDGRGVALRHLGDVQVVRSHGDDAKDSYQRAMASFDEALSLTPGDIGPKFNKATALQSLGELKFETGNTEEGIAIYNRAITLFDDLLEKAPDFILAYNNKGLTLMRLGQLQLLEAKFKDAEDITRKAIATLDKAIELSPGYIFAHNNKGRALRNLALCLYLLGEYESAANASKEAETEFSWSTKTAPRDRRIHDEIAGVRGFLTIFDEDLLPNERRSLRADLTLHEGDFDQFLELVGESSAALGFKSSGIAHRDFNALLQVLSGTEADKKVEDIFGRVNKQYQAAIKINPQNYLVLRHWASLLHQWAKIKTGVEADRLFALACEKYEAAFHDSGMHWVLNDWGVLLCDWAKTKCGDEADRLFKMACEKHEASLKIKPTKEEAYLNWGGALYAQALNKSNKDAEPLLVNACEKYAAGLRIKPDDFMMMHNLGLALKQRAFGASGDESDQLFELACEKFESALEVNPDEETSLMQLELTLSRWGDVIKKRNGTKDPTELKQLYESIFKHFEVTLRINPNQEKIFYFWGNALIGKAGITNDPNARHLLSLANEKFQTAVGLKPDLYPALVAWGTALLELARIKSEESQEEADQLFEAACGKFENALDFEPELWEAILNWSATLAERAKRKSGEEANRLWSAAIEKYEAVVHRSHEHKAFALHSLGTALLQRAIQTWKSNTTKDKITDSETEDILKAAIGKFEAANRINPNDADNLVSWGEVLMFLAVTISWDKRGQEATTLYAQAFERLSRALRMSPKNVRIRERQVDCLSNWASALLERAKTTNKKTARRLPFIACEKLQQAHTIDPKNAKVLRDWGIALYELAESRKGKEYIDRLTLSAKKLEESIELDDEDLKAQLYWSKARNAIAMTQMTEEQREFVDFMLEIIRKSGYDV